MQQRLVPLKLEHDVERQALTNRQRLILTGLYLSKFDSTGVRELGFESFVEAFNVIGYSLGSKPASIKNYRDEFDPVFPNNRKGWHHREMRANCYTLFQQFGHLDFKSFTALVSSFFSYQRPTQDESYATETAYNDDASSSFAQRLITGMAAERYFESKFQEIAEFEACSLENTTQSGCGYDFKIIPKAISEPYKVVEVKGLKERAGGIALTTKEFQAAQSFRERFFLIVVRNFREAPFHTIFQDPAASSILNFRLSERRIVQRSWVAQL